MLGNGFTGMLHFLWPKKPNPQTRHDVPGLLRRIRQEAELTQRDLASQMKHAQLVDPQKAKLASGGWTYRNFWTGVPRAKATRMTPFDSSLSGQSGAAIGMSPSHLMRDFSCAKSA